MKTSTCLYSNDLKQKLIKLLPRLEKIIIKHTQGFPTKHMLMSMFEFKTEDKVNKERHPKRQLYEIRKIVSSDLYQKMSVFLQQPHVSLSLLPGMSWFLSA